MKIVVSCFLIKNKKQTIVGCRHCYNGVQKKCSYCGELLGRQSSCNCEGARQERRQKQYDKDLETWNKAKKISLKQAIQDYVMVYIDNNDKFINIDEFEDWLHDEEFQLEEVKSLRVYGTYPVDLSMNASNIIEMATEDLHEDAMDNISGEDEKELQDLLDQWCEKNKSGTTTYYADFKVGIQL